MEWDDLKIVLTVYREGGASAAAEALGVSHATISRRVSELETRLGVVLVDRAGVGWRPTPLCAELADEARAMETHHFEAMRLARAFGEDLAGQVRITIPTGTVSAFIARALAPLRKKAPEIRLLFQTEDELTDLSGRKADIAIRFTRSPDLDLIGEQVATSRWGYYCDPSLEGDIADWLDREQLPNVPLLTSDPEGGFPFWAKGLFSKESPCNYVYGFHEKAALSENGFGVTHLPRIFGDKRAGLHLIQQLHCKTTTQLWVLANSDTRSSKRISIVKRALIKGLRGLKNELNPDQD